MSEKVDSLMKDVCLEIIFLEVGVAYVANQGGEKFYQELHKGQLNLDL